MNKTLFVQLAVVAFCVAGIGLWAVNFPYPSPLIKPFLAPRYRYPGAQIVKWVDSGAFPDDFLEFFARDPDRVVPSGDNIVSPADGFVREILVRDGITYLMVQLTFWDVHVVRTPISGVVKSIKSEGVSLFKKDPKDVMFRRGKVAPVQKVVTLATNIGDVRVRLIANYWASRLKVWVGCGEKLKKGERIGRMVAGSTVVAEFPGKIKLSVAPGNRVLAGETIVASGVFVR